MRYVDGFVLTVPVKKLKEYKKMAAEGGKIWMKHGALQYMECVGDDLTSVKEWGGMPFPKMAEAKKGETVFFSFIVYKNKKHRDAVNKKVMKEMEKKYDKEKEKNMPFDMKRMAYGGFEAIVDV
jgi:uncharacterized protein YbaA (DUF1428 family)